VRNTMLVVTVTAFGLAASLDAQLNLPSPAAFAPTPALDVPGSRLPVEKERRYVMSGAVRPLLFWIGRDDIGIGRIVWRRSDDGARGYELLVGTDPAHAPRGINRWGFVSEEASGGGGSVLALMTGSHETSYEEEAEAAADGASGGEFRTIWSRMSGGATAWHLSQVRTREALTVHQVAEALDYLESRGGRAASRRRAVARDVRSGFLVAVADLLDATVAASHAGPSRAPQKAVQYIFGEQTYELLVRDVDPVVVAWSGRKTPAVKVSFQTRGLSTGNRSRFELTAGTAGDTAGVPMTIEWQPRWWLKVRLRLEDPHRVP
jgi:hypothetical protein